MASRHSSHEGALEMTGALETSVLENRVSSGAEFFIILK